MKISGIACVLLLATLITSILTITLAPNALAAGGIAKKGLVAEWKFQKSANDSSKFHNDGVISGATFVKGITGSALCFDGVNDVVVVPNDPSLNFGIATSFSISLWLKSSQSGGGDAGFGWLVDHRRNNDGVYSGYTIGDNSGIIEARIRDGVANDVAVLSNSNVNNGKYHHVVLVVDRANQVEKLYIDNTLEDTGSISTVGNINTSFDLHLGGTATPNTEQNFFDGTLDQVRIYRLALSESHVKSLFEEARGSKANNACTSVIPPNLIADGGFESGNIVVNAPEPRGYWGSTGTQFNGGTVIATDEDKQSGGYSLKISGSISQAAYVYQFLTMDTSTYTFSFWYKGTEGRSDGQVLTGWGPPPWFLGGPYNPVQGSSIVLNSDSISIFPLDGQWHHAAVVNTEHAKAYYLDGNQVACDIGNTVIPTAAIIGDVSTNSAYGTFYFDNVSLVRGEQFQVSCP